MVEEWTMQGKPALVLIHMQHAITDLEGKVAFLHAKATWESGIIPRQQALLAAFREKGLPVIYVVAKDPPTGKISPYGRFFQMLRKLPPSQPDPKDSEVLSAVANLPGEPVIGNYIYGIFSGNTGGDLKEVLAQADAEVLVLCGVSTGAAVMIAAIQAADMFYPVIVPSDASIDADQEIHNVVMNKIIAEMALVTTADDVIAHL